MTDITKCSGKDCPHKDHCYRYTCAESYMQSWFTEPPINEHGTCDRMIDTNSTLKKHETNLKQDK